MVASIVTQINPNAGGGKRLKVQIVDSPAQALSGNGDFAVYNLGIKEKNAKVVEIRVKATFDVAGTVTGYSINAGLRDVDNSLTTATLLAIANFATNGTGAGKSSSGYMGTQAISAGPQVNLTTFFDNDKQFAIVATLSGYTGTSTVTLQTITIEAVIEVDAA